MRIKIKDRSKTNHLSIDEIENLKSEYYAGINTKLLVEKYRIDVHPNSLYNTFPFIKSPAKTCKYCASDMYYVPPSKNAKNREEYFCTTCLHAESIFGCDCRHCKGAKSDAVQEDEVARLLNKKKVSNSNLGVGVYIGSPSFNMLSLKEKSYLGAVLRAALNKKYLLIDMRYGIPSELAPTQEYGELIMAELLTKKIITAYSPGKNVALNIANDLYGKILYDICIDDADKNKEELIAFLMYPNKITPELEIEAIDLLKEIQINEAIEYMMLTLQQFNLPTFEFEKRYEILFFQILSGYSQGQLFNFIYIAIRNQAAYTKKYYQGYIPISNYVYKSISDRYEKARMHNWEIINFRRAWKGGQSELSKLLSSRLLDVGEDTFYQVL